MRKLLLRGLQVLQQRQAHRRHRLHTTRPSGRKLHLSIWPQQLDEGTRVTRQAQAQHLGTPKCGNPKTPNDTYMR